MENENIFYTLIPLAEFKAILGIDDREDLLTRFVLSASTLSIEEYCKRSFLRKKHTEYFDFTGDYTYTLREYPVRKICSVRNDRYCLFPAASRLDKGMYRCLPPAETGDCLSNGSGTLIINSDICLKRGSMAVKVCFIAGYAVHEVPADLKSACLEYAFWNMGRYRERRIGMAATGTGNGDDPETALPEPVKVLLEPYRRKML